MNTSGEAADQVVKMMLEGSEVLIRLTGSGAKEAAVLIYSILRQQKKTKGAARLSNMLASGKALRVYTFKDNDLKKFREVAREYGILYTVLKHKDKTDDIFDVMVRADDEYKINRIVERFELSKVDSVTLKAEIVKENSEQESKNGEKDKQGEDKDAPEHEHPEKSADDIVTEQLMGEAQAGRMSPANPEMARTESEVPKQSISSPDYPTTPVTEAGKSPERDSPSESSSQITNDSERPHAIDERPSVRKRIEEIKRRRAEANRNPVSVPVVSRDKTHTEKER